MRQIIGYGGKNGGGSEVVEAPDSLHSISYAKVLDLVSEGEIQGLANGMQSVFFNETPLQNPDGSYNFQGATIDFRPGNMTQQPIDGFPDSSNEIGINVELRSSAPWVRSISNLQLTSISVRLGVNALSQADTSNGNINGYTVQYQIEISTDSGAYQTVITSAFSGKTTSAYQRSHRIKLPAAKNGWTVRVTRLTPNANSSTIQDTTMVLSYTELIDARLSYPMSALVGIQIDAKQFQSIPTRAYDLYGRIVQVPSNYNPVNRLYAGTWDGTFKPAWTNNPAWIFYDLLTNARYGLGSDIPSSLVDKWGLYAIGQYCDQLVPDGKGGTEPRFTCNVYLQTAAEAYKLLQDLAALFRGITYWAGGAIVASCDMPQDPVYQFTAANVIGGKFRSVGSSRKTRYTVANVTWNDPNNFYKPRVEYVADDDGLRRYGVRKIDLTAFGCTSQGQAHRAGQWALLTSRLETDVLSFDVALDGLVVAPGNIVRIANPNKAGRRNGGRISSVSGRNVTVDKAQIINVGDPFTVILPTGKTETKTVSAVSGNTVTVNADWSVPPAAQAVWTVDNADLVAPTYRIVSITEKDPTTFTISAVRHQPGKFSAIDNGTTIQPQKTTVLTVAPNVPTNLNFSSTPYWVDDSVSAINAALSWSGNAPNYIVSWRKGSEAWTDVNVQSPVFELKAIQPATYQFSVVAVSSTGIRSQPATYTAEVAPQLPPLAAITGLQLEQVFAGKSIKAKWNPVAGATSYVVSVVTGGGAVRTVSLGNVLRYEYTVADMKADGGPWRNVTLNVQAFGKFGTQSPIASVSGSNPQIGQLVNISLTPGIRSATFACTAPSDEDYAGIIVWCSTDSACSPVDANKIYDGIGTVAAINKLGNGAALVGGTQYFVRAAAYDTFGKDALNVSTAVSFTAGGVIPDAGTVGTSQLVADLNAKVNLIDAPVSVAGSVAQRIADEAAARAGADSVNAVQIAAEIAARQGGDNKNAGDIAAEIVARQSGDSANAAQIAAEIAARLTGDGKNASDIAAEIAQRQNGDTVLNSRVDVLSASFVGAGGENMYIGPDVLSVAPALYGSSLVALKDSSTQFGNPYGLKPGETLTLSADLWLDAPSAAAGESLVLWIWAHNAQGQWANAAFVSHASTVAVRKSAQLTLPADESAMSGVFLALYHVKAQSNIPADAGTAFAGRIQVERGTVATAYKAGQQRASAALSQEQKARADADVALGYRIDTVKAQADGNAAAITQEAGVRASAVDALSSRVDAVKAQADGNAALLTQEQKARADADGALAARVDVVTASANNAIAAINDEKSVRAGADGALAARIDAVKVTADGNAAAITQESAARVGADNALSARLDILTASTNNAISAISAEQVTRANADASLASQITTVAANFAAAGGENMYIGPEPMTVTPGSYGSAAIFIKDAALNPYGLQPGEVLTLSADLWLDTPSAAAGEYAQIYLWAQNASGGWTASAAMICTSSAVARKTASVVLPSESQMVAIGIALYHVTSAGNVAGQAGTAYAGRIQIERGGVATAYKAGQQRLGAALTQEQRARADADGALAARVDVVTASANNAIAAINDEKSVRAGADGALSARIDSVKAQADGNAAAITQEAGVRATAVDALSSRVDAVKAQADGNAALLTQEQKARADADGALAARVDVVTASANNAIAAINDEKSVRAGADGALSARIDSVKAQADGNAAAITQEAGVRASAVDALSSRVDAVKAQADGNAASLTQEQKARSDGDSALAARVDVVTASANNAIASINDEKTVRAGADGALSARIDAVKVTADGNSAAITQESAARVGADNALSARMDILTASTNNAISAISAEQVTRANADASLASQITTVAANFAAAGGENMYIGPNVLSVAPGAYGSQSVMIRDAANNPYALQPGEYLTISADIWLDSASAANGEFAQLYLWTQNASGGWTGATVVRGATTTPTRVSASVLLPGPDSALNGIYVGLYHFTSAGGAVGQVGTAYAGRIQVERGGTATAYKAGQQRLNAAVQTESIARANAVSALSSQITVVQTTVNGNTASIQQQATSINGLQAQFTVKTDVNGYVSGFGLATDASTGTPVSDFTVLADRFAVVKPGMQKRVPFVVTTVNGQSTVGIDGNLLVNGSIVGAALAANTITGDRVAAQTIQTGNLAAGAVTTQILAAGAVQAGNIQAGAVTADKLNVTTLSAVSGQIGLLRTAASGGRTEIADNVIKVFDEYGVLRVKIGNLGL